ncbi:MAG: hypothetical protein KJ775_01465 [Alphaproteobacteria bacterium]|nr:hypothetical protein [Alphaproteobacteria bacterium]MBU2092558.1 hypothetical protein [Alphaproteobacteria bacterium]MBU2309633.1 hypothetical protein [Alphaproteobacteria bacterium]
MISVPNYLIYANEASLRAETATDPLMRDHFTRMAMQWQKLATNTHGVVARRAARAQMI